MFKVVLILTLALPLLAVSQTAEKIDEFGDNDHLGCEDYLARVYNLMTVARGNPTDTIYVILYDGRVERPLGSEWRSSWSQQGLVAARTKSMIEYFDRRHFDASHFRFVDGGIREHAKVEFWSVPPGAPEPKPSPTLRTLHHRKGGPRGFCIAEP